MSEQPDAVVVGAGPNGLVAAIELARKGLSVTIYEASPTPGGGARSAELTGDGCIHDVCSAAHPLGVASPALRALDLENHGLQWAYPEIDLAHPLDGGDAAVMERSMARTAAGLGEDGKKWARRFGVLSEHFDAIGNEILGPILHLPKHPLLLARFGIGALQSASLFAKTLGSQRARALFAGNAAHAFRPLHAPMSASVGIALISMCHRYGWPVALGGSQAITDALVSLFTELGGQIVTDHRVTSMAEFDGVRVQVYDVAPRAMVELAGDRLAPRVRRAYQRFRHGPSAFKVDFAIEGGVPWSNVAARKAGTLHLGGSFGEIASAESAVAKGKMPERPFVLVGQQYLADPTRSMGDLHPVWSYAHVPHGYSGDATEAIIAQFERFAPGMRERIVAKSVHGPMELEAHNVNYVGGDIATGANDPLQLLFRPRVALDPYATGIAGVAICSAATPPGAGVHGMCGWHAARSALQSAPRSTSA